MSRSWTAALLLCPMAIFAQVTGSISGTVVDPSGSAIVGAMVKLTNEGTGAVRTETAGVEGNFVFNAMQPAIYTVSAEHPGFKKYHKQHIELTTGDNLAVGSLVLSVGDVTDTVTVQAEGAVLQTQNGERSGVVTSEEIQDLTVLNRDFTTFAELQPGVVINVGSQVQSFSGNNSFNVLGGRSTGNNITVDGLPVANNNQSGMNSTISLDNTQTVEVKVSNFSAEYGRNNGFAVMAVSKAGTRQFHGAGYYYVRNEAFNANSFFNNRNGLPQIQNRVSYLGGNLGGPLHVPHFKPAQGKLFFLISVEQIREKRSQNQVNVTVPTLLERRGDFSQSGANAKPIAAGGAAVAVRDPTTNTVFPGAIIPSSRIIPSLQNYLNLLPVPNFVSAADLNTSKGAYNYVFQESPKVPKWLNSGRLDYNHSSNTNMFARFNYWYEDQQGNNVTAANTSWPWMPVHYTNITPSGVLSLTHIFSPTLVFQGSAGFSQFSEAGPALTQQALDSHNRQQAGFTIPQLYPNSNPYNLVPAATFGVNASANPSYNNRFPLDGVENIFTWNGSLAKNAGRHTLKAGFNAEHWATEKGRNANFFAGSMNFTQDRNNPLDTGYAYSNALLGVLDSYTETNGRFPLYEFNSSFEWYLQDTWKVSRSLTIDWGLRWGLGQPWHDHQLRESGFVPGRWNPAQTVKFVQPALVNGARVGRDPYTGATLPTVTIGAIAPESPNLLNGIVDRHAEPDYPQGLRETGGIKTGPRFGFAWTPFGNTKTVIRGGGGVFYNVHEIGERPFGIGWSNPPLQYNPTLYYTYLTQIQSAQSYNFPSDIVGFDVHRPVQKTYNFSFGVQRDIRFGTVIDVAYVGALGRHLIESTNLNSEPLGTNFLPSSRDATNGNAVLPSQFMRPYQGYGNITYYFYGGNSNYHSLQTSVRRRYKSNLTYGLVWTWSKAMNYTDTETAAASSTVSSLVDPKIRNYGKAGFDRTHIFRVYWNYNLPRASSVVHSKVVAGLFNNWQVSGIYTAQSGAPLGITYNYAPAQDITGSTDAGRVNLVANLVLPKDERTFSRAFNTSAVSAPSPAVCQVPNTPFACWGNAAKDVFRGPGLNNFDVSLFKNMPFKEGRIRAQLRVEAYNVFNHTQFTNVGAAATFNAAGQQTNGTFGQYTAAANPRNLQLALRLMF